MKIPQEENEALEGQKKVMYAKDKSGHFGTFKYGSKAEEFATKVAVHEFELLERESLENIKKGISSPLEYFMYKNRMDIPTLAKCVEMFSFRVKRHLKMKHFKSLNDEILKRYADVFGVDIQDIKEFK